MGHFDYDGSGYLGKHDITKDPWLIGNVQVLVAMVTK